MQMVAKLRGMTDSAALAESDTETYSEADEQNFQERPATKQRNVEKAKINRETVSNSF